MHVEQQGARTIASGEGRRHGDVILEAASQAAEVGGNEEPEEPAGPHVGHVGLGEGGTPVVLGGARGPRRGDLAGELEQGRGDHGSAFLPTPW